MEDVPYGPGDSPGGLLRCLLRPNAPPHPEGQEPGHRSINDTYINQTLIDPQVKDAGGECTLLRCWAMWLFPQPKSRASGKVLETDRNTEPLEPNTNNIHRFEISCTYRLI